jgi:SAM-dependent methyltransferase
MSSKYWVRTIRRVLFGYNPGIYLEAPKFPGADFILRFFEYVLGVTISRSHANRVKTSFLKNVDGKILEIGGTDDTFKKSRTPGQYLNLDVVHGEHVDLVEDAENMPGISSGSFDAVVCISVLEHTKNPERILSEILRVLKNDGKCLLIIPWLFESHMEPLDYHRFSVDWGKNRLQGFQIISSEASNGYLGLLCHFLQRNLILRILIGMPLMLFTPFSGRNPKWTTQVAYELRKI